MAPRWLQVSAHFCPAVQEAGQDPADGSIGLPSSQSGCVAAMPEGAPAQPPAGVAPAPAAASGRGPSRTAIPDSLSLAAARLAELQQPAAPTHIDPVTPRVQSRPLLSDRASRYGPSQVVPAPQEEGQHPNSSRPLSAAQQRQQSAQQTPSLARSVFSRVAVIGSRRLLANQQQQGAAGSAAGQQQQQSAQPMPSLARSVFARVAVIGSGRVLPEQQPTAAGSAAGQEELEAGPLGASTSPEPLQPQSEALERPESLTEAASGGMAAAAGSEGGAGPSGAALTGRGSRWVACHALHW